MLPRATMAERLLDTLRRRGIASARELGQALDASQPSVSRALDRLNGQVVRIGRARRTCYAATRDVRGLGSCWTLYRIDELGQPRVFGQLAALHHVGCVVTANPAPEWLRGAFADGLFPGLPWFLDDLRPQGFLGRQFAHHCARELALPDDLSRWDEDAVVTAMLLRGDDGPGNFILGQTALTRALGAEPDTIPVAIRGDRYAALAEAALAGDEVGSSAAGEQPKFTACVGDTDGRCRHVIVKFSESVDGNPSARRWADLLLCEYLAGELLGEVEHPVARAELIWSHGRLCLESTRFDRVGKHGRRGFVTLAALSDAHDGVRDDWPAVAERMLRDGWLQANTLDQIRQRWWFGRMIGNTDMHFGNLGFFLDDTLPLQLAPCYDMLPMLYRPGASGALPARELQLPTPTPEASLYWQQAAAWADRYWKRVAEHPEISDDFRRIAEASHTRLVALRQRFDGAHLASVP